MRSSRLILASLIWQILPSQAGEIESVDRRKQRRSIRGSGRETARRRSSMHQTGKDGSAFSRVTTASIFARTTFAAADGSDSFCCRRPTGLKTTTFGRSSELVIQPIEVDFPSGDHEASKSWLSSSNSSATPPPS